ncbi:MAG: hypothetical protein Ct9H90mP4_13430 [Gammaproteobacteria bacterium]|nr:MAG: hypothetical protein Ct9H90mP4_13430 [Gammaproteobacteria bacterium]
MTTCHSKSELTTGFLIVLLAQNITYRRLWINRGTRNTTDAVYGVRKVDSTHPDAIQFINSRGVVGYGAPLRPGVDVSGWPGRYNPMYGYEERVL